MYGVYDNNDQNSTRDASNGTVAAVAQGDHTRDWTLMRDNAITASGESTLDNGLTVGAYTELEIAGTSSTNPNAPSVKYSYAYFQGEWGRINLGR